MMQMIASGCGSCGCVEMKEEEEEESGERKTSKRRGAMSVVLDCEMRGI